MTPLNSTFSLCSPKRKTEPKKKEETSVDHQLTVTAGRQHCCELSELLSVQTWLTSTS